ncbi:MAG: type II toxin-antitoxin system RelE/ParE family toxin [Nitrospirota bacterium]
MTKIVWTDPAVQDLASIHSYITRDSNVYADALLLEIFHFVEKLEQFPRSGRVVPELNDGNTREIIVGNYRVIYDIAHLRVRILAVLHGARLFQNPKLRVRIDKR